MNSKDKPKRGEGKTFVREIKPRSDDKPAKKPYGGKPASARSEGSFKGKPADRKFSEKRAKPARKLPPAPATVEADGKPERISKILARVGVASRRDIERMIMEGRVRLNGKVLETPVVNVTFSDAIEVDGVPVRGPERTRLWLYHKPAGLVTTNSDPEGRPTVFDHLPEGLPRVLSIGRLDINTEGLLLLTNDGGLSRVLELPTTGWLRRYRVRAHGEVDQEALDRLKEGIAVDGVLYGAIDATLDRAQGRNVWITMGLREGKNREIKNVLGALGLEVNRLIRISYGPFQLGDLPEGQVVEVRGRMLRDQLGPRLIDEAKANFDAPVYDGRAEEEDKPAPAEKQASRKPERAFEDKRERREKASGRTDARRDDRKRQDRPRDAGYGGRRQEADERPKKRPPMGTSRTTNVWMAPGARPTADGSAGRSARRAEAEQQFRKPVPENDRRVVVNRAEEDSDWIRAEEPAREEKGGFDRKRGPKPYGDRPPRGDRKPREEGERPRARSFEKPRGEAAFGDRPRFERRPREDGDRPRGERPRGERPAGDRPPGDRPKGAKPFGKPGGAKSFGGKPGGAKVGFGGKPGGRGKPSGGGKPGGRPGGRPAGGKPRSSKG